MLRYSYASADAQCLFQALQAEQLPALGLPLDILIEVLDADGQERAGERLAFHCFCMIQKTNSILLADELASADAATLEVESLLARPQLLPLSWCPGTTLLRLAIVQVLVEVSLVFFPLELYLLDLLKETLVYKVDLFAHLPLLVDYVASPEPLFLEVVNQFI